MNFKKHDSNKFQTLFKEQMYILQLWKLSDRHLFDGLLYKLLRSWPKKTLVFFQLRKKFCTQTNFFKKKLKPLMYNVTTSNIIFNLVRIAFLNLTFYEKVYEFCQRTYMIDFHNLFN